MSNETQQPTQIYLVVGETGKHGDRLEWNVAAYLNAEEAQKHMEAAKLEANKVNGKSYKERSEFKNPYDPDFRCDYTGTGYFISQVELKEAFKP